MRRESNDRNNNSDGDNNENRANEDMPNTMTDREAMTLIPWKDIWASLTIARHGGNGEMVEVFYETLFKEAVFDDHGAWAWYVNKRI